MNVADVSMSGVSADRRHCGRERACGQNPGAWGREVVHLHRAARASMSPPDRVLGERRAHCSSARPDSPTPMNSSNNSACSPPSRSFSTIGGAASRQHSAARPGRRSSWQASPESRGRTWRWLTAGSAARSSACSRRGAAFAEVRLRRHPVVRFHVHAERPSCLLQLLRRLRERHPPNSPVAELRGPAATQTPVSIGQRS